MAKRCGERGAAAIEMAIILPLLLVLVGGIIDLGRAFMLQVILTNAAREGTRVAVVTDTAAKIPQITSRAEAAADLDPFSTSTVVVSNNLGDSTACTGTATQVTVTVTASFDWLMLDLFPITLPSELEGSSVMGC